MGILITDYDMLLYYVRLRMIWFCYDHTVLLKGITTLLNLLWVNTVHVYTLLHV